MEIDYEMQIILFKTKTGEESDDIAIKYLGENDWNEEKATIAYFSENDSSEYLKKESISNSNLNLKEDHSSNSQTFNKGEDFNNELIGILGLPKEKSFNSVRY